MRPNRARHLDRRHHGRCEGFPAQSLLPFAAALAPRAPLAAFVAALAGLAAFAAALAALFVPAAFLDGANFKVQLARPRHSNLQIKLAIMRTLGHASATCDGVLVDARGKGQIRDRHVLVLIIVSTSLDQ